MRITVLGSGNAFHDDARLHAGLLVERDGARPLLVDAGATALLAARRHGLDLGRPAGLLVTHFHGDHLFGVPFLLLDMSERLGRTSPFEIAGPPGVEERCRALMALAYPRLECRVPLVFRVVSDAPFEISGFEVTARPVTHARESLGYRVSVPGGPCVAISGDAALDERLIELVRGADLAILELTLAERGAGESAHVALPTLSERIDELGVPRVVFVHTDDRVAREAARLQLGEPATDGAVFDV